MFGYIFYVLDGFLRLLDRSLQLGSLFFWFLIAASNDTINSMIFYSLHSTRQQNFQHAMNQYLLSDVIVCN